MQHLYAVINNEGLVLGISNLSSEIVDAFHIPIDVTWFVKPGDHFDMSTGNFYTPEPELTGSASPPKISETHLGYKITVNAFRSRFLPEEELAFEMSLDDNPVLRILDKRLQAVTATFVNLEDPIYPTVAIPTLVSSGILTAERANTIVYTPASWHELPEKIQDQYIQQGYEIDVL